MPFLPRFRAEKRLLKIITLFKVKQSPYFKRVLKDFRDLENLLINTKNKGFNEGKMSDLRFFPDFRTIDAIFNPYE